MVNITRTLTPEVSSDGIRCTLILFKPSTPLLQTAGNLSSLTKLPPQTNAFFADLLFNTVAFKSSDVLTNTSVPVTAF